MARKWDLSLPIHIPKMVIPNAITGFSIFAGYLSIAQSLDGNYGSAAWFILAAGVLDAFDGRVARAMRATSEFGIQFDSLADVVNYGVAPSLLYYLLYFQEWGFVGVGLAFLPVVCASIRLARFNVQSADGPRRKHFIGLPTTVAAAFLASFVIFTSQTYGSYGPQAMATGLLIMAAALMVSPVRYAKDDILSARAIVRKRRAITGVMVLASLIVFPTVAVFAWTLLYIMFGLARGMVMIVKD